MLRKLDEPNGTVIKVKATSMTGNVNFNPVDFDLSMKSNRHNF